MKASHKALAICALLGAVSAIRKDQEKETEFIQKATEVGSGSDSYYDKAPVDSAPDSTMSNW